MYSLKFYRKVSMAKKESIDPTWHSLNLGAFESWPKKQHYGCFNHYYFI